MVTTDDGIGGIEGRKMVENGPNAEREITITETPRSDRGDEEKTKRDLLVRKMGPRKRPELSYTG